MGSRANPRGPSRPFQLHRWSWDVFICHAGEDKRFGLCLHRHLLQLGLRSFLDIESLVVGMAVPESLEAAVRSTQIAVVLLSEEFFLKAWPKRELRGFLAGRSAFNLTIVPVFLGVTHGRHVPQLCINCFSVSVIHGEDNIVLKLISLISYW